MERPRRVKDWISAYEEYNADIESPDSYIHWAAISTVAAALRRKTRLSWGQENFYPNFYVLLIGPSGIRKTTSLKAGGRLLDDLMIPTTGESVTRAALIKALEESVDSIVDTKEGTSYTHCSLTAHISEFATFMGYKDTQFINDLCDLYDCREKYRKRTTTQGNNYIKGVFFNLIAATTPESLNDLIPHEMIGLGLSSRIVLVYERRPRTRNSQPFFSLTPQGKSLYEDLKYDLSSIAALSGDFKYTDRFMTIYDKWYIGMDFVSPFKDSRFDGYWNRRQVHLLKLCMIYSVSKSDSLIIDEECFNRALSTLEKTEVNMHLSFSGVGHSSYAPLIPKILAYIGMQKEATMADLLEKFHLDTTLTEMGKILDTLIMARAVTVTLVGKEKIYKFKGSPI